ncbi:hypothetical protein SDC9_103161 [bioreactor metagenome]|uniref:Uncharacterized protein n=1 Tax=bioreactor metagenome TaxID=1076179 RepID=A0A645ATF2_9ZZZZ
MVFVLSYQNGKIRTSEFMGKTANQISAGTAAENLIDFGRRRSLCFSILFALLAFIPSSFGACAGSGLLADSAAAPGRASAAYVIESVIKSPDRLADAPTAVKFNDGQLLEKLLQDRPERLQIHRLIPADCRIVLAAALSAQPAGFRQGGIAPQVFHFLVVLRNVIQVRAGPFC